MQLGDISVVIPEPECAHVQVGAVTWQTSERMPVFQKPWLLSSTVTSRRMVFF